MEEIQGIVDQMLRDGRSEQEIATVIQEWERRQTEAAAQETATEPVPEDTFIPYESQEAEDEAQREFEEEAQEPAAPQEAGMMQPPQEEPMPVPTPEESAQVLQQQQAFERERDETEARQKEIEDKYGISPAMQSLAASFAGSTVSLLGGMQKLAEGATLSVMEVFKPEMFDTPEKKQIMMDLIADGAFKAGGLGAGGSSAFDKTQEEINKYVDKYETGITDSLLKGDFAAAGGQLADGLAGAIPSLAASMTGVGGVVALGTSTAGQKFTTEYAENDTALAMLDALGAGTIEATSELFTAGLVKGAGRALGLAKKGDKAAGNAIKEMAEGAATSLFKAMGLEGGSESAAVFATALWDKAVLGKEIDWRETGLEMADNFIIGAAMGGGVASVAKVGEKMNKVDKTTDEESGQETVLEDTTPQPAKEDTKPRASTLTDAEAKYTTQATLNESEQAQRKEKIDLANQIDADMAKTADEAAMKVLSNRLEATTKEIERFTNSDIARGKEFEAEEVKELLTNNKNKRRLKKALNNPNLSEAVQNDLVNAINEIDTRNAELHSIADQRLQGVPDQIEQMEETIDARNNEIEEEINKPETTPAKKETLRKTKAENTAKKKALQKEKAPLEGKSKPAKKVKEVKQEFKKAVQAPTKSGTVKGVNKSINKAVAVLKGRGENYSATEKVSQANIAKAMNTIFDSKVDDGDKNVSTRNMFRNLAGKAYNTITRSWTNTEESIQREDMEGAMYEWVSTDAIVNYDSKKDGDFIDYVQNKYMDAMRNRYKNQMSQVKKTRARLESLPEDVQEEIRQLQEDSKMYQESMNATEDAETRTVYKDQIDKINQQISQLRNPTMLISSLDENVSKDNAELIETKGLEGVHEGAQGIVSGKGRKGDRTRTLANPKTKKKVNDLLGFDDKDAVKILQTRIAQAAQDYVEGNKQASREGGKVMIADQINTNVAEDISKQFANRLNRYVGNPDAIVDNAADIKEILKTAKLARFGGRELWENDSTDQEIYNFYRTDTKNKVKALKKQIMKSLVDNNIDDSLSNFDKGILNFREDVTVQGYDNQTGVLKAVRMLKNAFPDTRVFLSKAKMQELLIEAGQENVNVDNIYGFTDGDNIYINPDKWSLETPIHEFSHLWLQQAQKDRPDLYQRGVDLMKQSKEYLRLLDAHENQPDSVYYKDRMSKEKFEEEVLATAIGKHGTELFERADQQNAWEKFKTQFKDWFLSKFQMGGKPEQIENLGDFMDLAVGEMLTGDYAYNPLAQKMFDASAKVEAKAAKEEFAFMEKQKSAINRMYDSLLPLQKEVLNEAIDHEVDSGELLLDDDRTVGSDIIEYLDDYVDGAYREAEWAKNKLDPWEDNYDSLTDYMADHRKKAEAAEAILNQFNEYNNKVNAFRKKKAEETKVERPFFNPSTQQVSQNTPINEIGSALLMNPKLRDVIRENSDAFVREDNRVAGRDPRDVALEVAQAMGTTLAFLPGGKQRNFWETELKKVFKASRAIKGVYRKKGVNAISALNNQLATFRAPQVVKRRSTEYGSTWRGKQDALRDLGEAVRAAVTSGQVTPDALKVLKGVLKSTDIVFEAAPTVLRDSRLAKNAKGESMRREHVMPRSVFMDQLFGDKDMDALMDDYIMAEVLITEDRALLDDKGYQSNMPQAYFNTNFEFVKGLPKSLIRYFNGNTMFNPAFLKGTGAVPKFKRGRSLAEIIGMNGEAIKQMQSDNNNTLSFREDMAVNDAKAIQVKDYMKDRVTKTNTLKKLLGLKGQIYSESTPYKKSKVMQELRDKYAKELTGIAQGDLDNMTNEDIGKRILEIKEEIKESVSERVDQRRANRKTKEEVDVEVQDLIQQTTGIDPNALNPNSVERLARENASWISSLKKGKVADLVSSMLSPDSNNDFYGLLYKLMPKKNSELEGYRDRNSAKSFIKEKLTDPLEKANLLHLQHKNTITSNFEAILESAAKLGFNKKTLQEDSGIVIDGNSITNSQAIKIYNYLKDPSLYEQVLNGLDGTNRENAYDLANQIIEHVQSDNGMRVVAERYPEVYQGFKDVINSKLNEHQYRGVQEPVISTFAEAILSTQDPAQRAAIKKNYKMLQKIYGNNIPQNAPYTPLTAIGTDQTLQMDKLISEGGNFYSVMSKNLQARTGGGVMSFKNGIEGDVNNYMNGPLRTISYLDFAKGASTFFSSKNMKAMEAGYGSEWATSVRESLKTIITGRTAPTNETKASRWLRGWFNKSVGGIMFLNVKSSALQLLSTGNFAVENPGTFVKGIKAGKKARGEALRTILESQWFQERGKGKTQLETADIFDADGMLNRILQGGYALTKFGDKTAIALGGAPYVAGRVSEGIPMEQAMQEFVAMAEETQQSTRPERLGREQRSTFGRIMLAFANTPMQYNRKMARALQDVTAQGSTRDQKLKGVRQILYYGAIQNAMFSMLQNMLLLGLDIEEPDENDKNRIMNTTMSIMDTLMRGSGIIGATVATVKNIAIAALRADERKRKSKAVDAFLNSIPAVGTKARQLGKMVTPQTWENSNGIVEVDPIVGQIANGTSFVTNFPAHRLLSKFEGLNDATAQDLETIEKLLRVMGWSRYAIGADTSKIDDDPFGIGDMDLDVNLESPIKKIVEVADSEEGVEGRANKDGTIEVNPNLSPARKRQVIQHEQEHARQMKSGELDYTDDSLTWKGKKYDRKNGKIFYNGKWRIEGDKSFPWEQQADAAESPLKSVDDKKKKKKKGTTSAYIPGYTKHISRGTEEHFHQGLGGSEGGQGGLVMQHTRPKKPGRKGSTAYTAGALQNSYGDPIGVAGVGREWELGKEGKTKIGVHGGATVGYGKSFKKMFEEDAKNRVREQFGSSVDPEWIERHVEENWQKNYDDRIKANPLAASTIKSNIMPLITATIERDLGAGFGMKAVVNPMYVNAGLSYTFGKKKKRK